jgi:hypothetical protein
MIVRQKVAAFAMLFLREFILSKNLWEYLLQ